MELIYPQYYEKFRCIAGQCPDSCCKEWEVDVDDTTAQFYRSLPGDLGQRLRSVLRQEDGSWCMTIENGRCPMWRTDGLCRIQAEIDHDALCQTCRDFPRLTHEYGDFTELGLELSCPEAARLIFTESAALCKKTLPGGGCDYDAEAMQILLESRRVMLEFWQETALPLPQALNAMLLYAHGVQSALDGGELEPFQALDCLQRGQKFAGNADLSALVAFFRSLEILTDRWQQRLDAAAVRPWNEALRPLPVYFIQRYWLQAVSDLDIIGRVKMMVTACILVNSLGGDPVQTAQLFSKEIENDPDNMEAILDGAYTHPALTDRNLLGLLTQDGK